MTLYHGGIAGLAPGDLLRPAPPHVEDGCLICRARAEGRVVRVAEYRLWLAQFGDRALPALRALADAPADEPIDPPSARRAVYLSSDRGYARWYAARSCGDLYVAEPLGPLEPSAEDLFPAWTTTEARVVRVLERGVRLTRQDRREMDRRWRKAERRRTRRAA